MPGALNDHISAFARVLAGNKKSIISRQFTLGKHERLKRRKIIDELFRQGKYFVVSPFRVQYRFVSLPQGHLQAGFSASSRNFKKAVHRNRIKRLTREAWRLQKNGLEKKLGERGQQLALFFIYTGKELPEYQLVYDKIGVVVNRLLNLSDEVAITNM